MNPWRLTAREAELMDALCRSGLLKVAAAEIGMSNNTARGHMKVISARIGERTITRACIKWTEWRSGAAPLRLVA